MSTELQNKISQINGQLWPVEHVMQRLSIGRTAVFHLMASGELRSVKVGRRRLVSEAAINEYVARLDGGDAA